jgi:K+-sensing histidine kinase KdpD
MSERILVVDDDSAILTLCHRILQADGYAVVDAKRGEEAIARLQSEPFDLLLTDIRLPGLDGLEVTARLRGMGLELAVVTMTGYSNMEMAIQALSLGVDEFIVKPFNPDTLRLHIARALEKQKLRRENARLRTLVPLLESARGFAAARTRDEITTQLLAGVVAMAKPAELALLLGSPDHDLLTVVAAQGEHFSRLRDQVIPATYKGKGQSIRGEGPLSWDQSDQAGLPALLRVPMWISAFPVRAHDKWLGVMVVARRAPPSAGETEVIQLYAAQAALALEGVDSLAQVSRALVQARELERIKGEFINVAGHELRTPLAIALGYAILLRERLEGELQELASQVVTQTERVQRVTNNLLQLKYLQAGESGLRLEDCAVDETVRKVVNTFRPLALEREQTIELVIEPRIGEISVDRAMFDVIIGSLLSNAIRFSPGQSLIQVQVLGDADQVTVRIVDKANTLTNEQAEHVFDAFYQVQDSLTRQQGVMGLGLTLARKMVRAHGGDLWVESRVPPGNSFVFCLPRKPRTT